MTLHLYFARKYFMTFGAVFSLFGGILYLIELVENVRNYSGPNVSTGQVLSLTLLQVPIGLYASLPLIGVIATIAMYLSLARTSELVVSRAAGRSAMRSLIAPLLVALMLGTIAVAVLNPIVAATSRQYEETSIRLKDGAQSVLSVSSEGLWLRQGSAEGQTVIRASGANLDGTRLTRASFLGLTPDGRPSFRLEAASAELTPGAWQLSDVKEWRFTSDGNPESEAVRHPTLELPSELTRDQIRNSFGTPSAIAFWDLPAFIARLDAAGFSAQAHRVWYQAQLALPLTLAAMVMIGAGFTMRHTRMGRTGLMVLLSVLFGFLFHFTRNFSVILAENGQIPSILATWGPPVAAICLSLGLLLHLEDG